MWHVYRSLSVRIDRAHFPLKRRKTLTNLIRLGHDLARLPDIAGSAQLVGFRIELFEALRCLEMEGKYLCDVRGGPAGGLRVKVSRLLVAIMGSNFCS